MPDYHILKELATGVIDSRGRYYPFQVKWLQIKNPASELFPPANGRFYIKSVFCYVRNDGTKDTSIAALTGTQNGTSTDVMDVALIPSAVGVYNVESMARILLDLGRPLYGSCTAVTPTDGYFMVNLAVVEETGGQYM